MIETKYEIQNKYNKTIALIADIHFSKYYPNKRLNNIIKRLSKSKPDYICIAGDIIDDAKVIDDLNLSAKLINWLQSLSLIAPLIISYGNHDEVYIRGKKSCYVDTTNFFHQLNSLKNIYFLENENINFKNINFIGYRPERLYFERRENYDLTEDIKKVESKIKSDCYNILICHSPIHIMEYNLPVDLILSGHMHDGLIFPFLKHIKGNSGLVGPYRTFFPKYSRGIVKKEMTSLIITGGVRKISNSSSVILRPLNIIYPSEITYIKI